MIYVDTVRQYCQEYWKIENYDQAVADTELVWHCHHRHEIDWALPMEELIAIGRYYDVHYSELIFLTPEEHMRLHMEGNTWNKGKHLTEETKQRMSDAKKGKEGYWKGKEGDNAPNYKYHITAGELYDLYVVQGLSTFKIADLYGCGQTCIWRKLKKYNITKNG